MPSKVTRLLLLLLLTCFFAASNSSTGKEKEPGFAGLTVHEWGTFTSIAGRDGRAVQWAPLTGATDLPAFVEHFRTPEFKLGLRATVRMETPVLYFYGSQEQQVSVQVNFARGLITEWYPRASRVGPAENPADWSIFQGHADGSIAWDAVTLAPALRAEFPREETNSHYYAARMTSATPLLVKTPAGQQQERFLFYRGVASFQAPLSAKLTPDGLLQISNLTANEIPNVIWFERRSGRVGYRIGGAVREKSVLSSPELNGTVEDLGRELEGILVAQGLYLDEARAMVETWRDSWFEEGSRLMYIVPRAFVDGILPLTIHPVPAQTERVFIGRMELVTRATENAVESAFASHHRSELEKYGRFLEPILHTMIAGETDSRRLGKLNEYLSFVYSAIVEQPRSKSRLWFPASLSR